MLNNFSDTAIALLLYGVGLAFPSQTSFAPLMDLSLIATYWVPVAVITLATVFLASWARCTAASGSLAF